MSLLQIADLPKAFCPKDVVGLDIYSEERGKWVLRVYLRCSEPFKIEDEDYSYLVNLYEAIVPHLGGVDKLHVR